MTRLWYVRIVDQRKTILTGMTRDGTFLIENGRLTRGVRNLRFNQSLVDALGTCTFANEQHRTGSYSYALVAPAVQASSASLSRAERTTRVRLRRTRCVWALRAQAAHNC